MEVGLAGDAGTPVDAGDVAAIGTATEAARGVLARGLDTFFVDAFVVAAFSGSGDGISLDGVTDVDCAAL